MSRCSLNKTVSTNGYEWNSVHVFTTNLCREMSEMHVMNLFIIMLDTLYNHVRYTI